MRGERSLLKGSVRGTGAPEHGRGKRYAYEVREKALRDHISMMNYAMEKGLQEGRDKGYAEGRDKGYAEGREEGCDRVNRLNCLLMKDKRYEEMARAAGGPGISGEAVPGIPDIERERMESGRRSCA